MTVKHLRELPWGLWRRQVAAIVRLELRKTLLSKRAWWIYLLALGPVLLAAAHSLMVLRKGHWGHSLGEDCVIYAGIFQLFYLKLGIFFGCVGVFANLFRGEVLEKTLHYYLLAPVRREVLAVGKYLAGLAAAALVFAGGVALSYVLLLAHFGPKFRSHLFNGPGLEQLGWYVVIALLACTGYGAIFLVAGLAFRNPMIPAALVMVWEGMNAFLPPVLKKFSVIFYLKSLCPVSVPLHGFLALIAVDADPAPAWLAIPGLLLVTALVLAYASLRVRRLEISYGE